MSGRHVPTPAVQLAALDRLEAGRVVVDLVILGCGRAEDMARAVAWARDQLAGAVVMLEHEGGPTPVSIDVPAGEESITWLVDVDELDYVRQDVRAIPRRSGRPGASWVPGRIVGWSNLAAGVPAVTPGRFRRRVFWVAPHDRSTAPLGVYRRGGPHEAVDPRTVAAGVGGLWTARAAGRS